MNNIVLCFTGGIKSGKSTVSQAIANDFDWPRVSFGDFVRDITHSRGLAPTRENWQKVGEELVRRNVEDFCAGVLDQASWHRGQALVVDGIRHVSVLETLRAMVAPTPLRLVCIDLDVTARQERLNRIEGESRPLAEVERHSTEDEVKSLLPRLADLVLDGTRAVDELVVEVRGLVQRA